VPKPHVLSNIKGYEDCLLGCARFLVVACLAYSSTRKMEAVRPSKMLVSFYLITWCHIAEDGILFIVTKEQRAMIRFLWDKAVRGAEIH
jgi:hypothetical protein